MPCQRFLRPEITNSEKWNSLDWMTQSFFIRLITRADDYGRCDGREAVLLAECFAVWNALHSGRSDLCCNLQHIVGMLQQLAAIGMVVVYDESGKRVLQIEQWHERVRQGVREKWPARNKASKVIKFENLLQFAATCRNPPPSSPSPSPSPSPFVQVQEESTNSVSVLDVQAGSEKEKKGEEQGTGKGGGLQAGGVSRGTQARSGSGENGTLSGPEIYRLTQAMAKAESKLSELMAASRREVAGGVVVDHGYDNAINGLKRIIADYNRKLGNHDLPVIRPRLNDSPTGEQRAWISARKSSGKLMPRTMRELGDMMAADAAAARWKAERGGHGTDWPSASLSAAVDAGVEAQAPTAPDKQALQEQKEEREQRRARRAQAIAEVRRGQAKIQNVESSKAEP